MNSILQSLLSPNTVQIKEAEVQLAQLKTTNFAQCFQQLVQCLNSEQGEIAALLIQNKFLNNNEDIKKLEEKDLFALIQLCHSLVSTDKKLLFLKRISEIVVKVCAHLEKNNEIIQFILTLNNKAEEKLILTQLYLIEIICEFSFDDELLMEHKNVLSTIFETHLNAASVTIKVACMRTFCCFLVTISNETFLKQFSQVFPVLLQTSVEAIKNDEEAGRTSLESLSELVEVHPKFVKPNFSQLLELATEVLTAKLESTTKGSALNIIHMMSIQLPQLMRKSDYFVQHTLKAMCSMVTSIDLSEDLKEWESDLQESNISKNDEPSQALDAFGKMAPELGSKFLIPKTFLYIQQAIQSAKLEHKYASIMILSQICIEAKEHFSKELKGMLDMIFSINDNTNPRMTWANLTCLAMLCEEFAPEIETTYTKQILEYINLQMQHPSPKVQLRAVSCLLNFTRALADFPEENECLKPYCDSILTQLSTLFQKGLEANLYPLIEEVLLALSTMAEVMSENFTQYYNHFMPGLKNLLSTLPSNNQSQVNIRVLTIECIGFMVSAVQSVQIPAMIEDQKVIMKTLIDIQNMPHLQKDDPHHAAILSVYSHLANAMKENFAQYLPYVFEKVISAANITVDFTFGDQVELDSDKMISKTIDLKMFGGKKTLALNAHAIEQKVTGSGTLLSLVTALKRHMLAYLEPTLQCIALNLQYKHSKQIRQNSVKTLPGLLLACENEQQMQVLLNQTLPLVVKELDMCQCLDDMYEVLESLYEMFKLFRTPLVTEPIMNQLMESLESVIKYQNSEKDKMAKKIKDGLDDMDDQQREDFEDEYEEINNIMQISKDLIEEILKKYQGLESRLASNIGVHYMNSFSKKFASEKEKIYALLFFCNLLEFCTDAMFAQAFGPLCEKFLTMKNPDEEMNQALAYGFGIMARRAQQEVFGKAVPQIKPFLQGLVQRQGAFETDQVECTEVAVHALGKLALFQGQTDLLNDFMNVLPLKSESIEAQNCHKMVIQQYLAKNQALADPNLVKTVLQRIQEFDARNPTLEILDDDSKSLLAQL